MKSIATLLFSRLPVYVVVFLTMSPFGVIAKQLNIVSSISPVHALVSGVIGDKGNHQLLLPVGRSPHDYVLRPSDARKLARADIIFHVGSMLETFLEKPLASLAKKATLVTLIDTPDLNVLKMRDFEEESSKSERTDPHVWMDPVRAKIIVAMIARTMSRHDPANRVFYQQNAKKLYLELDTLNVDLESELAPYKEIPFITYHDAFHYFDERYSLKTLDIMTNMPGFSPSAGKIHSLRERIKKEKVSCVFTEAQFNPSELKSLFAGLDFQQVSLDPLGNGNHFSDYINMMQQNTRKIIKCLSQSEKQNHSK